MSLFICPVNDCSNYFDELRLLLFHVHNEHHEMQYTGVGTSALCCKVIGCRTVTKTYHAFRMHMLRKHQSERSDGNTFASIGLTDTGTDTSELTKALKLSVLM